MAYAYSYHEWPILIVTSLPKFLTIGKSEMMRKNTTIDFNLQDMFLIYSNPSSVTEINNEY